MVRIDEIEDFYKKEIERIDKEFLEKLSKTNGKKERGEIETEYKIKNKAITEEYNKKISNYLKEQKQVIKEREKNRISRKKKKENFKVFEVKKLNLNESWKDKQKYKWDLYRFKHKINSKNFRDSHTPEYIKISIIKIKLSIKNFSSLMSKSVADLFSKIKRLILNLLNYLKETGLFIYKISKKLSKWLISKTSSIFSKIFKKKGIKENKEKRPDEEIAERLLKKKIDD